MKKIDPFFEKLVQKYFPEDTKEKVNKYLKENDDLVSDSSVIFHVFNLLKKTKFDGSFEVTWKKAIRGARLFFPVDRNVEKFVVASLLKFAIAKREKGEDHYQEELDSAKKFVKFYDMK